MSADPELLLRQARQLHQQGRLQEAEQLYLELMAEPNAAGPRHMLGVLRLQLGRNEEALALIEAALVLRPGDAEALVNRGTVLRNLNRPQEALESHELFAAARTGGTGEENRPLRINLARSPFTVAARGSPYLKTGSALYRMPSSEFTGVKSPLHSLRASPGRARGQ